MAGEAARRIHAIADPADDRVRVGRHVVKTGPGADDGRAGGRREPVGEPPTPVLDQRLVDLLAIAPPWRRLGHREPQRLAAPAKVEPGLLLDSHRQVGRQACDGADVDELPHERADWQVRAKLRRGCAACDDQDVVFDVARIRVLQDGDVARCGTPNELASDRGRLGDPVLPARDRAEDIVCPQVAHPRWVHVLDRHAELPLRRRAVAQPLDARSRGRDEHVTDLLEERWPELAEQLPALTGEAHLGLGRELLTEAAHRLSGRATRDLAAVGEHDIARAEQREVVRDRRAYGAGAGDDDSSHVSSSFTSSAVSVRSGRRTSGWTGMPRRASTVFSADWNGNR